MVPGGHHQLGQELWTEKHPRNIHLVVELQGLDPECDSDGNEAPYLRGNEDLAQTEEYNGAHDLRMPRTRKPPTHASALPSVLPIAHSHFQLGIKQVLISTQR